MLTYDVMISLVLGVCNLYSRQGKDLKLFELLAVTQAHSLSGVQGGDPSLGDSSPARIRVQIRNPPAADCRKQYINKCSAPID